MSKYESGNNIFHHFSEIYRQDCWLGQERTVYMSENNAENKNKHSLNTGAAALISVLAVPVTLLASLLISNKRKK